MAFRVGEVTQILEDYNLRIKTRALPSYINLDKFQGYVNDIKDVLKQSTGDTVSFKDYNQFLRYMQGISRLKSVILLPSEKYIQRNLVYPPRTLKYLKKIREKWLLRRNMIILPPEYLQKAADRSRAYMTQFNPQGDFKFDRARNENIIDNLIHKIESENIDKGKEVENVMIDFPRLNYDQVTAIRKLYEWGYLMPTDPRFTITQNDLNAFRDKIIKEVVPNIAQIRAKQAEKQALEAEEAKLEEKKAAVAAAAAEADEKRKQEIIEIRKGKAIREEGKPAGIALSEKERVESELAAMRAAGAEGVPESPKGPQASARLGGAKASAGIAGEAAPTESVRLGQAVPKSEATPVLPSQPVVHGGIVPTKPPERNIARTEAPRSRALLPLEEILNRTYRPGSTVVSKPETALSLAERRKLYKSIRGTTVLSLPWHLLAANLDYPMKETIGAGVYRLARENVAKATKAVGRGVGNFSLDAYRAISGGIAKRADTIVIGGVKPLQVLKLPVTAVKTLWGLPGNVQKAVSHKVRLEMFRNLSVNFKLPRKIIFSKKAETSAMDLARQLILNYGAKFVRDLAENAQKFVGRATGTQAALANVKTAGRLERLAALTPEQLQDAIQKGKTIFVRMVDGVSGTWQFTKAGVSYGIPIGIAIGIATGSLPAGVVVGVGLTAIKGYDYLLASRRLNLKEGYGQFLAVDKFGREHWNYALAEAPEGAAFKNLQRIGSVYSRTALAVKAANTGLLFGSIAFALAPFIGLNPVVAGVAAFGVSAGASAAWNYSNGKLAKGLIEAAAKDGLLAKIIRFPLINVVNMYINGLWLAEQLRLIKNVYRGDIVRYLRENYNVFDTNQTLWAAMNWLSAIGSVTSVMEVSAALYASQIAAAGLKGWQGIEALNPASAAATAGFLTSMIVLTAFGVPIGPIAIAGGLIGSILGVPVGLAIAAPEGFFTVPVTVFISSTFLSGFFASIGSYFDKMLNSFVGNALAVINGIGALINLLSMGRQGIKFENMIPLAMALIGFITAMKQSAEFNSVNDCLPLQPCAQQKGVSTEKSSLDINPVNLKYYGVSVVSKDPNLMTQDNMRELLNALDALPQNDSGSNKRQIVIVFGLEKDYYDDQFAFIGMNNSDLRDSNSIRNKLSQEFTYLNRVSLGN